MEITIKITKEHLLKAGAKWYSRGYRLFNKLYPNGFDFNSPQDAFLEIYNGPLRRWVGWMYRIVSYPIITNSHHFIFSHFDFKGFNLSGLDFSDWSLDNSDFSGCNLVGTNFSKAALFHSNFEGVNAKHANFSDTMMQCCKLCNSNLRFTNFEHANMQSCDLSATDLKGANFKNANLYDAIGYKDSRKASSKDKSDDLCIYQIHNYIKRISFKKYRETKKNWFYNWSCFVRKNNPQIEKGDFILTGKEKDGTYNFLRVLSVEYVGWEGSNLWKQEEAWWAQPHPEYRGTARSLNDSEIEYLREIGRQMMERFKKGYRQLNPYRKNEMEDN
jgi:hypothetical protein